MPNLVAAVEEALEAAQDVEDSNTVYMFIDIFTCAQHRNERPQSKSCPNKTDADKFKEVIAHCKRLLLYCTPITCPRALQRIWCLYELFEAHQKGIPVIVALSSADAAKLEELILQDAGNVTRIFLAIDTDKAQATYEEDRKKVRGWISDALRPNCFEKMDELVRTSMRSWLLKTMQALLQKGAGEDSTELLRGVGTLSLEVGNFDQAMECYIRVLELHIQRHSLDHPLVADTYDR